MDYRAELTNLRSDYRTTSSMLKNAKRQGMRVQIKSLNKQRNRISDRINMLEAKAKAESHVGA